MTSVDADPDARRSFERDIEPLRIELRAYCYRMLGSAFDAEDAVQDALVRAWRHVDRFEGRAALKSWLYRIATNVCLDILENRKRRAMPADLVSPSRGDDGPARATGDRTWIEPAADVWALPADVDPAERAVLRDSVRLALVSALQLLPPRQRAALILREVLGWRPAEIAELLDTTVASVNSALQRARRTVATADRGRADSVDVSNDVLARYVDAFERYDTDAIASLLHADATFEMPPSPVRFSGVDEILAWVQRKECGGVRYLPLAVNGGPGCALYRATAAGEYEAFAIQAVEVRDGRIANVYTYVDGRLVELFGLSPTLVA